MKTVQERHRQFRAEKIASQMQAPVSIVSKNIPSQGQPQSRASKLKSTQEISSDITELKKQRNKDQNDIRIMKVELVKLQQVFKKYKSIVPKGHSELNIELPDFVQMAVQDISTEQILVEIQKIKNLLYVETQNYRDQQQLQQIEAQKQYQT